MLLPLAATLAVGPRTAVPNGLVRHLDLTVQELRDRGWKEVSRMASLCVGGVALETKSKVTVSLCALSGGGLAAGLGLARSYPFWISVSRDKIGGHVGHGPTSFRFGNIDIGKGSADFRSILLTSTVTPIP